MHVVTDRAGTTVLVVGGGPAGLAAAAELAKHGVGCLLIEPRTEVSHRRPRAKTTSIKTMEHLRRWGVAGQLRKAAPLPVAWSEAVTFCEALPAEPRGSPTRSRRCPAPMTACWSPSATRLAPSIRSGPATCSAAME